jgi:predicted DNA-binding protein
MDSNEFHKKMHTINDIVSNAINELEDIGYIVNVQERIFDAKSGGAEIKLGIV